MSTRILYKWEENNHGLDHKCGTCATVLSSPRAKKTCFGKHEEVCSRYHKTLFFIGQSNHCDACHKTIELHDKRHREIATIIQRIHSIDRSANENNILTKRRKKSKRRDYPDDAGSAETGEICEEDGSIEWNDTSTLHDDYLDTECSLWDTGFNAVENKKAAKEQKKLAKNQIRFQIISSSELQYIQSVLHPDIIDTSPKKVGDDQGLINNSTIESNIAFTPGCFRWGSSRQGGHNRKALKDKVTVKHASDMPDEGDAILQAMLKRFRVVDTPSNESKERKNLRTKLISAIQADLIAHGNEQVETMRRMAGYWRYVNRRTYNEMVRVNLLWDWATGQKLPEIDESEVGDSIEEDEVSLGGPTQANTPLTEKGDKLDVAGGKQPLAPSRHEKKVPGLPDHLEGERLKGLEGQDFPIETQHTLHSEFCGRIGTPVQKPQSTYLFQKDSRSLSRAIREASPPRETPPREAPRYRTDKSLVQKPSAIASSIMTTRENAFGALRFEVPAPCEDPQLPPENTTTKARFNPKQRSKSPVQCSDKSFPVLGSPAAATEGAAPPKSVRVLNITAGLPQPEKGRTGRTLKITASPLGKENVWMNVAKVRNARK